MIHLQKQSFSWDLLILILTLGLILFGIGSYGLYEPHETHFAMVAKEINYRQDWITPYLNGQPYLNKPPFLYWLIAISQIFFTRFTQTFSFITPEFIARFPVALSGWLSIILVWKWSRDLWGIFASRISALMLSVTCGWFIFTHQILIDVTLTTLVLASNYFLWKLHCKPQSWIYFFCLYTSIAFCFLTKGLIGLAFILFNFIALAITHRNWQIIKQKRIVLGTLFILVLILPWSLAIEKANPGFWHYFFINEHFDRILDRRFPQDYEVSKISALGFLGITGLFCFPWILFLPHTIKFTFQEWQRSRDSHKSDREYGDGLLLLAIAFLAPIIIFLPLSSRLIYYSIPAIPFYIILCSGFYTQSFLKQKQNNKHIILYGWIVLIIGILFCLSILLFPYITKIFPDLLEPPIISSLIISITLIFSLGWLVSGIETIRKNKTLSFYGILISLAITYTLLTVGFSLYQDIRSSKKFVTIAKNNLPINTLWIFEGSREIGAAGGISYYLNLGNNYQKNIVFKDEVSKLPLGWIQGKGDRVYRNVLVLKDAGDERILPNFPGAKPNYSIDKKQLQNYWDSNRPVIFITDFLRNSDRDSINPNLPQNSGKPLLVKESRKLYGNIMTKNLLIIKQRRDNKK